MLKINDFMIIYIFSFSPYDKFFTDMFRFLAGNGTYRS